MRRDVRVAFGIRVRELRRERDFSQEALAELSDLHRNYIGGIERGERNVSVVNIAKLADAFGLSLAELFEPFTDRPTKRR